MERALHAPESDEEVDENELTSSRKSLRTTKGLRHFSIRVCQQLSESKVTTYNDIANLLVAECRDEVLY